jgi:hypothetical protein
MKLKNKILAGLASVAVVGSLAIASPASAITGSYVTNVGTSTIKVQQAYNGPVYTLGYGSYPGLMVQAVVIPIGQCYKIQRAPGYSYGEYCNFGKGFRYITMPDYQHWNVYRSR